MIIGNIYNSFLDFKFTVGTVRIYMYFGIHMVFHNQCPVYCKDYSKWAF